MSGGRPGHGIACAAAAWRCQQGISLLIVVMLLVVVSLLGLAAAQIAIQGERVARNDRDRQIAHQSAEAALLDATYDIEGASTEPGVIDRSALFSGTVSNHFVAGCGSSAAAATSNKGLCAPGGSDLPDWQRVNMTSEQGRARSVEFGEFSRRRFPANAQGIAPAQLPRYLIEAIPDYGASMNAATMQPQAYRITAIGFGPRSSAYVVLQIVYRK